MLSMCFSASRNAFYRHDLKERYKATGSWPADAVEVTDDVYQEFKSADAATGKQRDADANGRPCWVDIPPASLADLATAALRRINTGYSAAIAEILAEYPDAETLSFDKQEKQATAWDAWQQAGAVPEDEPATPYLDAMLEERPIGKDELVERIIAKANAFTAAHGLATGRRQRLEDQVKAALKAEDRVTLETVDW